jgi:hypothetical protein
MFQTVRHWWNGGRGKVTLRLFVFEFVVVVAGVLVAQALAGYAQQRSDLARMEMERSRVRYELESAHSMFQSWSFAVPCLNRRMMEIMSGKQLSSHDLHRPSMPTPNYSAPDSFTLNLIAQRYGIEEKNLLKSVADQIASITMRDEMIISAWGRLALLDPANGPFSNSDRTQARIAAAEIKGHLRSIEVMTDSSLESLRRLRIRAHNHDENTAPATSCAAIWQSGRLDPPIATS